MFYRDLYNIMDAQRFIRLRQNFIIRGDVPEYLSESHHLFRPLHTTGTVDRVTAPLPIHLVACLDEGQRLIGEMLDNDNIGINNQHLADMFRTGVAVPHQEEIAQYLETYCSSGDGDQSVLSAISALIDNYVDQYTYTTGQSLYCYPATYLAKLREFGSFVQAQGSGENRIKVPRGIPVLNVYYSGDHATGEFRLVDSFDVRREQPLPFSQVMLRNYINVPRTFVSRSLGKRTAYIFVLGVLSATEEQEQIINEIGLSTLSHYVGNHPDIQSDAYQKRKANTGTENSYEKGLEAASLKCVAPLFESASFCALDCAYMNRDLEIQGVSTALSKTEKLLSGMGFTIRKETVNKNTVSYDGTSRTWYLGEPENDR